MTLIASTGASTAVKAYERATARTYAWSAPSRALAEHTDAPPRARGIVRGEPAPALHIIHGSADAMLPDVDHQLTERLSPAKPTLPRLPPDE